MWTNQQEIANLVTFTEEILNSKLKVLCSAWNYENNTSSNLTAYPHEKKKIILPESVIS